MDKYLIKPTPTVDTFDLLEDEPIAAPSALILGILGHSSDSYWSKKTLVENLITPILEQEKTDLHTLLLPNEGNTSILLQAWADCLCIKNSTYASDWKVLGRRARGIRDSRILKESSHLLIFLGTRSDYYEKIAIREVKKGRVVYTVDAKTHELVQWEL